MCTIRKCTLAHSYYLLCRATIVVSIPVLPLVIKDRVEITLALQLNIPASEAVREVMVKLLVYAVRVASPGEPKMTLELFGRDHVTSRDVLVARSLINMTTHCRDKLSPVNHD